jgi:ABC-type uncharacterized transport system substrate-binding protein
VAVKRREFITLLGGAAAGWPLAARAQQPLPVVGFLHQGSAESLSLTSAFRKGLSEVGFLEGQNVAIEHRAADGQYDRLPALAVIAANYLPAALAAKAATQTIPIVFLSGSDPIGAGLVSSMNRPTANVTGIAPMFTLLGTKNLDLLHEFVPKATAIGALANTSNPNADIKFRILMRPRESSVWRSLSLPVAVMESLTVASLQSLAVRSKLWSLPLMVF